jgi:phosphatidylglycerol:prolipoprotein diacylglycerol transferase
MDPVLVQIGPVLIRWYGVMMAATILTALWVAFRVGPLVGVSREQVDRMAIPFILLAFAGARAGYVLSHPAEFAHPIEILRLDHGGLTSHGAIAGGILALWWGMRRSGVRLWDFADATVWVIPLGNVFVRFGNFMNGELYGDPTTLPWGVTFPNVPGPRHPLQLYEMLLALIILAVTLPLVKRRSFSGQLFWTVVLLTSLARIALDLLRSEDRVWGVLTLGQIPAALLVAAGLWVLLRARRTTERSAQPAARTS